MSNTNLQTLAAELLLLKSVLITSHVSPDPDAVGSAFGLALGLRSIGISANVYLEDDVPPRIEKIAPVESRPMLEAVPRYDAVIAVDSAAKSRVGKRFEEIFSQAKTVFNIDHHISNIGWADRNYIDASASSTAQIILELLTILKCPFPNPAIGNLLFAGVCDDTGRFCFSSTTSETLRTAATLIDIGGSPSFVAENLYFTIPERVMRLRMSVLPNLERHFDGLVTILAVTKATISAAGAYSDDTEGLIEEVRTVEGTLCGVLCRELEDGWKFSLRSQSASFDVNAVASIFGGGGHKQAAGCKLTGSAEDVRARMLEVLESSLRSQGFYKA